MIGDIDRHQHYMQPALEDARSAMQAGNRPERFAYRQHGEILGRAGNTMFTDQDPRVHAEIACTASQGWGGAEYG